MTRLHRVGGAVHGAAVQVALGVRVAAVPDAAGPARGVATTGSSGRRRGWRQWGRWRWLQLGLGRGWWRRGQVVMGVQEAELGLPERVLVVLLVPPEMLRGFECSPSGAVAALAAARPGRHVAALCLHPGRLRAPLPRRVHRASPSAFGLLLPPLPKTETGLSFRLVAARGSRPPRGGSASGCDYGMAQGSLLGGQGRDARWLLPSNQDSDARLL